ncbi:hypothetical protein AMTRI_Chr05g63530 [Amborella trichopoda]
MLIQSHVLDNLIFFLFCVPMFWPSFLITKIMMYPKKKKKIAKHVFMQDTLGIQNVVLGTLGSKQPLSLCSVFALLFLTAW